MKNLVEDTRWNHILTRNKAADGSFFYGVRSTGVYCRPSCPSRRPGAHQVQFFDTAESARQAGFRSCRRCFPDGGEPDRHKELIESVCRYIEQSVGKPSLNELAQKFHISQYHLQRTFKSKLGISPRQYSENMRTKRLRQSLRSDKSVTTAIYDAGYESSSSAYNRSKQELGMTPGQYKSGAQKVDIEYMTVSCKLGWLALGATVHGISLVLLADSKSKAEQELKAEFPQAKYAENELLRNSVAQITRYLAGEYVDLNLPLDVKATAFQQRVWSFLRTIPYGETLSYRQVAERLGQPTAFRAVARACATNPVSLIVPCHRVVRGNGELAGYRWGLKRKQALITMEQNQQ